MCITRRDATDKERGDARGRSFWDSNVISETSSAVMARAIPVDLLKSGDPRLKIPGNLVPSLRKGSTGCTFLGAGAVISTCRNWSVLQAPSSLTSTNPRTTNDVLSYSIDRFHKPVTTNVQFAPTAIILILCFDPSQDEN